MSFLTNYSNVNVTVSLNTADLSTSQLNVTDITNLTITGSINGQALSTSGSGTVVWRNSPVQPIAPATGDKTIQYKSGNSLASNNNLTYDYVNSTLRTTGSTRLGNLSANSGVALSNLSNVTINGGTNGQVLVTDGLGNVNWANSTGSSVNAKSYVLDYSITPIGSFSNTTALTLKTTPAKSQYIRAGVVIAFGQLATTPGAQLYTITSANAGQTGPNTVLIDITLNRRLVSGVNGGTPCSVGENVAVNSLLVGGSLSATVSDSLLTLSRQDNIQPTQVAFNLNTKITGTSALTYSAGQLTNLGSTTVQRLTVTTPTDSTFLFGNLNFTNTTQPGTLVAAGGINFLGNLAVTGTLQAKAYPSKRFKFARYALNNQVGIPEGSANRDDNFTTVTFDRVITDTTELTFANGVWTNNTGRTIYVYMHYSILWQRQGNGNQGYGRASMIVRDNDHYNQRFAYLHNYAGNSDNFVQAAGSIISLGNGQSVRVQCWQYCGSGTINIGGAGASQAANNSCKVTITQLN